jgi:hypothetical protein
MMAVVFGFITENLKNIPIDIVKDFTGIVETEIVQKFDNTKIKFLKESSKSKKKLVNYFAGVFELSTIFLSVI